MTIAVAKKTSIDPASHFDVSTILIYFVAILFFSISAEASLTGSWRGRGHAHDISGWNSSCNLSFNLQQSASELKLLAGLTVCGATNETWHPFTARIQGESLIVNDRVVGTISETHLHAEMQSVHGEQQKVDIDITESSMSYRERWYNVKGVLQYQINGQLANLQH
jgi:hypothetical protein